MTAMTRIALAVLVSFVVVACSAGGATPAPSEPPGGWSGNLAGRTFLSTAIDGRALVPGSQVSLTFGVGTIGASAGCNSMGGTAAIVDGRLVVGDLATTEMACARPLMDQDAWLAEFLDGAAITLDGDILILAKDRVVLTLGDREVVDADRPLVGTPWVLDGIVTRDSVSSVPMGITAGLAFEEDRVSVQTGCNSGGAPVEVSAETLAFGPLVLTEVACEGAAMEVERAVTAVLSGTAAYRIEAGTLTIDRGGQGLVYRAEP
jgi:heat shock protein HslJ